MRNLLDKKDISQKWAASLERPMREFVDMPEATKIYSGDRLKELEKTFDFPKKVNGIWRPF